MADVSPQQYARWDVFTTYWRNTVRPGMAQAIAISELAANLQVFFDDRMILEHVFDETDSANIKKSVDAYNRVDRAISKAELGTYGVRFTDGDEDVDILAPPSMNSEEYQEDVQHGFGAVILTAIAIGAVVVGGLYAVSKLIDAHNNMIKTMMKKRVLEIIAKKPEMAKPLEEALDNFFDDNKENVKKSGLFDYIFGSGTGQTIGIAIAAGVILVALAFSRRR